MIAEVPLWAHGDWDIFAVPKAVRCVDCQKPVQASTATVCGAGWRCCCCQTSLDQARR